jgi:hypothetical protein
MNWISSDGVLVRLQRILLINVPLFAVLVAVEPPKMPISLIVPTASLSKTTKLCFNSPVTPSVRVV